MLQALFVGLLAISSITPQTDGAEAPARRVIDRYVAAREAGDEKALAALFTDDVDQLVSTGEWRRGRADVVRGTLTSSQAAGGKRTITVESVRLLSPDVAVADGRYEIAGVDGGATRRMWTCIALTRTRDGWRIAAIRNMLPAPAAR
jgi:uncharacterized protein (TIGR02246 family)